MLLFAYLYTRFDLFHKAGFLSSFHAVRPVVPAMAIRAVLKISDHALVDSRAPAAGYSSILVALAAFGMLLTLFSTPFFATLGAGGLVHACHRRHRVAAFLLLLAFVASNVAYIAIKGLPPSLALAAGSQVGSLSSSLFVTGLLAGATTFGGAFTAVPYVYRSLVTLSGRMTPAQFLDGIAVVNFVPTPLVMFVTWDGFISGGVGGAILMTLGMFLPCFTFVLVLHEVMMAGARNPLFTALLEGVSAVVVGLIAETACQLTKAAVHNGMDALVFACAMFVLSTSKLKNAPIGIIVVAALAGQVLYENGTNQG